MTQAVMKDPFQGPGDLAQPEGLFSGGLLILLVTA